MRVRFFLVASVLAAAACSGVLFDTGNAFPCDFSQPPGARDLVCAPGDVCGADDLCQHYVNEGPRFEGPPTLPDFSADAGAGAVLHPRLLKERVERLAVGPGPFGELLVEAGGTDFHVAPRSSFAGVEALPPPDVAVPYDTLLPLGGILSELFPGAPGGGSFALGLTDGGLVADVVAGTVRDSTPVALGPAAPLRRLRAAATGLSGAGRLQVLGIGAGGSQVGRVTINGVPLRNNLGFAPLYAGAAGSVLDVGWVERPDLHSPVILTRTEVLVGGDGGFVSLGALPQAVTAAGAALKSDPQSNVFAVGTSDGRLSTWLLVSTGAGYQLQQAWPDCKPCGRGAAAVAFAPTYKSSGLAVEVLCRGPGGGKTAVRVVGSTATDPDLRCDVENVELPFESSQLSELPDGACVQDTGLQSGVALGGARGRVWVGSALSTALPLYLDRVPLDVAVVPRGGQPDASVLMALTDKYLARETGPDGNGLLAIRLAAAGNLVGVDPRPVALLHEAGSWALTAQGDLAHVVFPAKAGDAFDLEFGPRLVDGRGEPVQHALSGEAYLGPDGGPRSALLAVDDSLYFVPFDFAPADTADALGTVGPVLTPEPSTLIRSLALERTPVGSNGVDRMRGYAVTSRNVYQFQLGGAPPRWTAAPVFLWGGEPVETWFDNPRGGLARVGYRDGTVFTLPGGFQLVEALPARDGGVAASVLDFENLGGWPVALASSGLYVARWPLDADGRLELHFPDGGVNKPMQWFEVTLPGGGRPWLGPDGRVRAGKLFVRVDPTQLVGTRYFTTFHLLLFLDDQVLEVGRHVRSNASPPPAQP